MSEIKESSQVSEGSKAVKDILDSFKTVITMQRHLLDLSAEAGDEGTNALMSDYIRAQEKLVVDVFFFYEQGISLKTDN